MSQMNAPPSRTDLGPSIAAFPKAFNGKAQAHTPSGATQNLPKVPAICFCMSPKDHCKTVISTVHGGQLT